jgi:glycosyltransferase involved in cell wall biosynthesis
MPNSQTPDVYVLLPIRPAASGLIASVQSIKAQSFTDWHIIALLDRDNGDNLATLKSLLREEQFTPVICDYKKDGFPAMLNRGLEYCHGQFVARQDDDDISMEDRFELQVNQLNTNDALVLSCGFAEVVDRYGVLLYSINQPEDGNLLAQALTQNNVIPHSSAMFRKTTIEIMGGYRLDLHGCEDYDLWLRMISLGSIASVGQKVLTYLSNPEGMTKTPISVTTIRKLRTSRMAAQKVIGTNLLKANLHDLVWTFRQLANQYL